MISLRHIIKIYEGGTDEHALGDVSLDIPDGDVFGIIGISGAGKSTLVRCINLLERPTSGSVIVDGTDVTNLSGAALRSYRRRVAMIFQGFGLLAQKTALENVCFPFRASTGHVTKENRERARALLDEVGLADKAGSYPAQLSGGQQQRVAIARALACEPEYILCDEATSALDPEWVGEVLQVMHSIAEDGMTMMVVSHEMRFVRSIATRVVYLDEGKVLEDGTPDQVFNHPRTKEARRFLGQAHLT